MRKLGIISVLFVVLVFGIVGFSFQQFLQDFSRFYTLPPQMEAIVVLTGGKGRLEEAFALFKQFQPRAFFIAGAGTGLYSLFSKEDLEGVEISNIYVDQKSRSTYQNAVEAKHYMIEKGIRSIVLVTSNYHMKRAFFLFREVFPNNIEIISYAIESDHVPLKIAFLEYIKYYWQYFLPPKEE